MLLPAAEGCRLEPQTYELAEYARAVAYALAPTAGFTALALRARRRRGGGRATRSEQVWFVLAECASSVLVTVLLWPVR